MAVHESSRASVPVPRLELEGIKVLVVGRDGATVARFERVLGGAGAVVVAAHSAGDALAVLRDQRPDLIACEIGRPDCNGLQLMRCVRMRSRLEGGATPALALTAAASQEAHTRALLAGYQAYLPLQAGAIDLHVAVAGLVHARRPLLS
jgi:CheY-like chemotaxis protein